MTEREPDPLYDALRERLRTHERVPAAPVWEGLARQLAERRRRRRGWVWASVMLAGLAGGGSWLVYGPALVGQQVAGAGDRARPAAPGAGLLTAKKADVIVRARGAEAAPFDEAPGQPDGAGSFAAGAPAGPVSVVAPVAPGLFGGGVKDSAALALATEAPAAAPGRHPVRAAVVAGLMAGSVRGGEAAPVTAPAGSGADEPAGTADEENGRLNGVARGIRQGGGMPAVLAAGPTVPPKPALLPEPPATAEYAEAGTQPAVAEVPLHIPPGGLDSLARQEVPFSATPDSLPLPAGEVVRVDTNRMTLPSRWVVGVWLGADLTHRQLSSQAPELAQRETAAPSGQGQITLGYDVTRRLRLSTGLGYRTYRQQLQTTVVRQGHVLAYVPNTIIGADGQPIQVYSWQTVPVDSVDGYRTVREKPTLRYLTLPLVAEWRLDGWAPRWQVALMGGPVLHLLVSSRTAALTTDCECETKDTGFRRSGLGMTMGFGLNYALRPDVWLALRPTATYMVSSAGAPGQPERHPFSAGMQVGLVWSRSRR